MRAQAQRSPRAVKKYPPAAHHKQAKHTCIYNTVMKHLEYLDATPQSVNKSNSFTKFQVDCYFCDKKYYSAAH